MTQSASEISRCFLELMVPAVRQAAGIARALEGQVSNRPKAGETTPVKAALTVADSAAQEAILAPLTEGLPSVALRAEEDTPSVAHFPKESAHLVVVDPIDGTLHAYLEGAGPYSVMTGLAHEDRYAAGVVALPREDLLVYGLATGSVVVTSVTEPEPLPTSKDSPTSKEAGRDVLVSQGVSEASVRRLRDEGYNPRFGSGGAIAVAPLLPGICAGLRVSRGPEGVSIRGRIGVALSRAAGCRAETPDGLFPKDLWTRAETLMVARSAEDLAALRRAVLG